MSDSAVATIVAGSITIATMVIGFLTLWVKLRYGVEKAEEVARKTAAVEVKLDNNTSLTKEGTKAAADNAATAVKTASEAKEAAVQSARMITDKLNGGLDKILSAMITPVREMLAQHMEYVHLRNHDILNALNPLSTKLDVLIEILKQKGA